MRQKKKKYNTFKTKLVVSYIVLVLIVACAISVVDYINIFSISEKQTYFSLKTIQTLSKINSTLHAKYLSPFAKQYVILKAEKTANQIKSELKSSGGYKNIHGVKNNINIQNIINQDIEISDNKIGILLLIDKNKNIILAGSHEIEGLNHNQIRYRYPALFNMLNSESGKNLFSGYCNMITDHMKSRKKFFAAAKIPDTPLYLIAAVHVNTYLHPVFHKLKLQEQREINQLLYDLNNFFNSSFIILILISAITLATIIIISLFVSNILAKSIATPIQNLNKATAELSQGNFDVHVKETGTDETIQLAKNFNSLGTNLKKYIEDLKKEIINREKIEGEINAARKLQSSRLPKITDEFIRNEFNIYARLAPAKNVAGDFYDFFYLDKKREKLTVLIGDVSGKGIPAAFFMGVAKTVIKHSAVTRNIKSPGKLLSYVNNALSFNNSEAMFVSLFIMFYDIKTGKISYANAGHLPALKINEIGLVDEFGQKNEPLLGIFKDTIYKTYRTRLLPNESIVLYTDGITEAFSPR